MKMLRSFGGGAQAIFSTCPVKSVKASKTAKFRPGGCLKYRKAANF
jgi:hypothetical protein